METSRFFVFSLLVSSSLFLPLLVECHLWGSSGARGHFLFPQHEGNGKTAYHPLICNSFSVFLSHASGSIPCLWVISLSLCYWGSRTCLRLISSSQAEKVVKCSYNVVLEIVSQLRHSFDPFITNSLFPSFPSQSSIFKIPRLSLAAVEADGQRVLCAKDRVAHWDVQFPPSFAS